MKKLFFFIAGGCFAPALIFSQETAPETEKPKPVFTISADAYYRYDFNKSPLNNKTSFTNSHNSFELGMASVKVEHTIGKVGMVADLGFGKRAEDFSYNDEKSRFSIKQLYLSYSPWKNFKFTAGSWATHVGYELVDAYANRNYSMSYMFSYGPFFHTGLKGELTVGKNGFMLGFANPTDLKSTTFGPHFILGQYSTTLANDALKLYLNYQGGKSNDSTKLNQVDLVLSQVLSSKFNIGFNGTVASTKAKADGKYGESSEWWGSAIYLNADPKSWLGLTLRTEYFSDKNQLNVFNPGLVPAGGSVLAATLSANFKIDNLTIIPEFRIDNASEPIFFKSSGSQIKSASSVLLAAVYKF